MHFDLLFEGRKERAGGDRPILSKHPTSPHLMGGIGVPFSFVLSASHAITPTEANRSDDQLARAACEMFRLALLWLKAE